MAKRAFIYGALVGLNLAVWIVVIFGTIRVSD